MMGARPVKLGPTVPNVVQGSQAIPGGGAYSKLDNSDDTLPGRDIDPQLCHLRPADSSGQSTREPLLRDAGRSVLSGAAYHGPGVDSRIGLRYSEAETALHGLCVWTGSRLVPGLATTDHTKTDERSVKASFTLASSLSARVRQKLPAVIWVHLTFMV